VAKIDSRIEALEAKLKQLKVQQQRSEQRARMIGHCLDWNRNDEVGFRGNRIRSLNGIVACRMLKQLG
jgi:hypothetical protein